ncbi:MAG TPA: hypothetical protein V6D12_10075 [Candidatus Obscuribacterales bacterium]
MTFPALVQHTISLFQAFDAPDKLEKADVTLALVKKICTQNYNLPKTRVKPRVKLVFYLAQKYERINLRYGR